MLAEQGKEGERFLPDSFHGVFDQLGRHETEAFTNMAVMSGDFFGQFLYCQVYRSGVLASSVRPFGFWIPEGWLDKRVDIDRGRLGVDAYLA